MSSLQRLVTNKSVIGRNHALTTRINRRNNIPTSCSSRRFIIQNQQQLRQKASVAIENKETLKTTTTSSSSESSGVPIVKSLASAFLAVCTVSATAAIVENTTASSVPTFEPKGERFDQSNFTGRFCKMLLACDPRLLCYTKDQVQQAKELLDNYLTYKGDGAVMDRALWEAKRITQGALHPDTGDWIPRPFRMSGYVPFNGPVCVAMVASQSTIPLLFWSWVNQSQNALVNYYNRNAASEMTNETMAKSYAGAVGAALCVAFGLATMIQKRYKPAVAQKLLKWVAFPSSVAASSLNCYIVRSPEIEKGIPLLDPETQQDVLPGETSNIAAARGVYLTTASRAMLQAPVYFVPPLLLSTIGPMKQYLIKHPIATVPVTTFLLLTCFGIGLPVTVAIFPQLSSITVHDVESKFQHLHHPITQKPYQVFSYNKGL